MTRWVVCALTATLLLVAAAVPLSAGEWGMLFRRNAEQPRMVYRVGYEGQYDYDLGNVPTFRYGYFGAHGRPTNSWSTNQYKTYKQWSLRPGS